MNETTDTGAPAQLKPTDATRVFVYGSLMCGGQYHDLLRHAQYLGKAQTEARYTLVDLGSYPGLLEGGHTAVCGEMYAVDADTLALLDSLEEHPSVYVRTPVVLASGAKAHTYLLRAIFGRDQAPIASGRWDPVGARPQPR